MCARLNTDRYDVGPASAEPERWRGRPVCTVAGWEGSTGTETVVRSLWRVKADVVLTSTETTRLIRDGQKGGRGYEGVSNHGA